MKVHELKERKEKKKNIYGSEFSTVKKIKNNLTALNNYPRYNLPPNFITALVASYNCPPRDINHFVIAGWLF